MNKRVKEWLEALLEASILLILLYIFCWPVTIDGISMENTFFDKDKIITSRFLPLIGAVEDGDIVIAEVTLNGKKTMIVKRLIAKGGDHITIKEGIVSVNNAVLEEPYAIGSTQGDIDIFVPDNCFFVLGDNREHSLDSRQIGILNKQQLKSKVIIKWYPFDELNFF